MLPDTHDTEQPLKVEVILPVRISEHGDAVHWLRQAVESIFNQTLHSWHLTIVDDASPIGSLEFINQLCVSYPDKCSQIRLPNQMGAAYARMVAVENSKSRFISFLDQDDLFHPEKLKLQTEYLEENPQIHAVHTDVNLINPTGAIIDGAADGENGYRKKVDGMSLDKRELASELFQRNSIRIISSMFRRYSFQQVGGYDCSLNGGEDWELWVRFADQFDIAHLGEKLLERRVHDNNTSMVQLKVRLSGQLMALTKMTEKYRYLEPFAGRKRELIEKKLQSLQAETGVGA